MGECFIFNIFFLCINWFWTKNSVGADISMSMNQASGEDTDVNIIDNANNSVAEKDAPSGSMVQTAPMDISGSGDSSQSSIGGPFSAWSQTPSQTGPHRTVW